MAVQLASLSSTSGESRVRLRKLARELARVKVSGNNGSLTVNTEEDLLATTSILKLSESVNVELVPGDDNYLDKKTFTWRLYAYDGTKVGFTFDFDHPEYISVG